jgi:hypothetical protein
MWPVIRSQYLDRDERTWRDKDIMVDMEPNECPYCHKTIVPQFFDSYIISPLAGITSISTVQSIYRCTNKDCHLFFIAVYEPRKNTDGQYYYYLSSIGPRYAKPPLELTTIKTVSPKYYEIYAQAQFAEELGLSDICGMGFRKALEFLIRDYIKLTIDEDKTEKLTLSACINNYIEDTKIKEAAKRAAWLGNDETHYYRKWDGKDLQDLKILLRIAVNFIDSNLALERYTEEMI